VSARAATDAAARRRRARFRDSRLGRATDALMAGLFISAVAPFMLLPADWHIRAFGAVGRALLPLAPAAARIRGNLALVRPGATSAEARALAAGVGDNFGRVLAEYIRMGAVRDRPGRRRVRGIEHLRNAVAAGRGAVIVSAHLGNWEAIRLAARDEGVEVAIIYRAFNNRFFDWLAMLRIPLAGRPVLHKGPQGMRGMIAHLRAGGALLILVDQRLSHGEAIPFLGAPAPTATAVAAMAARLGAALIPAAAIRDDTGLGFDVTFEAPPPPGPPFAVMTAVNDWLTRLVEAHPGQWFWLHHRWIPARRLRPGRAP
jgi:KDO2-lipid IV(A) lauroyltransferase